MTSNFLSRYTPRLMSSEVLEDIFVQRHDLAQQLVDRIRDSILTSQKHYSLLIGARGMGKTHLVSLIYHRVRNMDDLRERSLIAWLGEEEWGVNSFLDLLLTIFQALQEEASKNNQPSPPLEMIESLYELPAESAEAAAVVRLKEFIGDHTLFLIMENLDDLFSGLGKDGQKQFRTFLEENSCFTVLATAQTCFDAVKLKKASFYNFFTQYDLEELTVDEATQLLANLAKFKGNLELENFIKSEKGKNRIQAIHHLAGGNHRLYIILSEFLIDEESLDKLVEVFMRTLDELTPYYQERMRYLSPQQRKIIDFLSNCGYAVPVKEIAQKCFITHQTVSSQLKKLLEMDYVKSESIGRESYYELREPLMRYCIEVKRQKGEPISLIVDFLRSWYTTEELKKLLNLISSADNELMKEYILKAIDLKDDMTIKYYFEQWKKCFEKQDFENAFMIANQIVKIQNKPEHWLIKIMCLCCLEKYEETIVTCNQAIEIYPDYKQYYFFKNISLFAIKGYQEILTIGEKNIDINSLDKWNIRIWHFKLYSLVQLHLYERLINECNNLLRIKPNDPIAINLKFISLIELNQYDQALNLHFEKIQYLDLQNDNADILSTKVIGYSLVQQLFADSNNVANTKNKLIFYFNCDKNSQINISSLLRQGIVCHIPEVMSDMISDKAARTWLEIWQELVGDKPEFQIALRLLNAAVEYREKKGDRRVLLSLPIEERKILEPLLKHNA
jgi:tetratricopeptide (TPR) repeat protein